MAEKPTTDNYAVEIHCHCELTSFSLPLPSSSFPLKSAVCHCNSCRHTTGQLFATWAVIPTPIPSEILKSGNLIRYDSSSTCERWFCKQCGASVINIDKADDQQEWEVATGLLHFKDENGIDGKLDRVQLWVEDIKADGGAVGWINKGELAGMDRFWNGRESAVVSDDDVRHLMEEGHTVSPESRQERLNAQCHCQKVAFSVARPEQSFNSGTGKFEANLDTCTSCRTITGFEVTAWTTVRRTLVQADGSGLDTLLADTSRLGQYKTSAGVSRYFCIGCGATVFYENHSLDTVDVGVGLLQSQPEGEVCAKDWLVWQRYPECLAYAEEAIDKHFVGNLAEGMRRAEMKER